MDSAPPRKRHPFLFDLHIDSILVGIDQNRSAFSNKDQFTVRLQINDGLLGLHL